MASLLKNPDVNGKPEMATDAHSSVMAVIFICFEQAAHLPQILFAVQAVNHSARAKEQQRFEERVRHQVEDARRERAHSDAQEHVAELRDGGVGEHFLDVHLRQADSGGEERGGQADHATVSMVMGAFMNNVAERAAM